MMKPIFKFSLLATLIAAFALTPGCGTPTRVVQAEQGQVQELTAQVAGRDANIASLTARIQQLQSVPGSDPTALADAQRMLAVVQSQQGADRAEIVRLQSLLQQQQASDVAGVANTRATGDILLPFLGPYAGIGAVVVGALTTLANGLIQRKYGVTAGVTTAGTAVTSGMAGLLQSPPANVAGGDPNVVFDAKPLVDVLKSANAPAHLEAALTT